MNSRRRGRKHRNRLVHRCRLPSSSSNLRRTTNVDVHPHALSDCQRWKTKWSPAGENELYPRISDYFPFPRVKNWLGGKMMLLDDVFMTTLTWFMTEGLLPQPQKDHRGLANLRRRWRSHADKPVLQLPVFHHMEHGTCQTCYSLRQSRLVMCTSFASELREIRWITLLALLVLCTQI